MQKHMSVTGLMRRLSLIGIDAIWQLSLGFLLMRTIARRLCYTGYLNFINGPIIVNEYDQEIPQSQTADNPVAPRGRAAQPSRDTRKTN